ncbi:MAG: hypothetical protein NVSMB25_00230 [Thermoleophilaceae bacterium]
MPHPPPPAELPELPPGVSRFPRWPAWHAPVALLAGIMLTYAIALPILGGVAHLAGAHLRLTSPGIADLATIVQDVIFVSTAVAFAAMTLRPRAWHFGLRGGRFWPTAGWAGLGIFVFLVLEVVYGAIVHTKAKQHVAQDLGINKSTAALIAGAIVVIVIAPVAEEIFFRGFFYRALRGRFGVHVAATIDGVLFGLIHYGGSDTLSILPVLALLGFIFCLVYERTGTIYATIALHALNNTIAYASQAHHGAAVAAAFGGVMLVASALATLASPRVHVAGAARDARM